MLMVQRELWPSMYEKFFLKFLTFTILLLSFFSSTLKSFQEEFFDETNENIISMFDLLLNVESNGNSENNDLRNQSTTRITNVRRYVIFFKVLYLFWIMHPTT